MKLFKVLQAIFIIAILTISCKTKTDKAKITTDIQNLGLDTFLIMLSPYDEKPTYLFDTIISDNGKFSLDTLIDELHHGYIISKKMFRELKNGEPYFIRSKKIEFFIFFFFYIHIKGENKEYTNEYKVKNGILNKQFSKFQSNISNDNKEKVQLDFEIENHYINNSPDSIIKRLEKKTRELYLSNLQAERSFIQSFPDYEISSYLLSIQDKDTIIKYFPLLGVKAKESLYGKLIEKQVNLWESLKIGSIAPDFEYLTIKNDSFKLSNYKGKYVILDFWGSWCGGCIIGIPKMKKYYEIYKERLEFVGIACRDKRSNWINAVDKHNLSWTQILNNEEEKYNLWMKYGIKVYPTKIIINEEGKIIGTFLGESDDFYNKLDSLLKE